MSSRRERRVVLRVEERRLELLERGHQDLGNVAPPKRPKRPLRRIRAAVCREAGRKRIEQGAQSCPGDLTPGRMSSDEPTSMA